MNQLIHGKTLDELLAAHANDPREWTCPEHALTYGEGKPDPVRMAWDCPKCKRAADSAEAEFHRLHARHVHWRRDSGIPHRYRAATLAHLLPHNPSAMLLRTFVSNYIGTLNERIEAGDGALLLGPPGLGKTLALCVIGNAACQLQSGVNYTVWPDTLIDLKAGFGGSRDDPRRQAVERLRDAKLLLLDELGVKGMSDFDHSELFGLVDYRYRHRLPTIAAANATNAVFADLVGERVADRLFEVGPTVLVTGESQRGKASVTGPDAFPRPPQTLTTRVHAQGKWRDRKVEARDHFPTTSSYRPLPGEI